MACGRDQICSFPQGRRAVQALLWSIFAFIFCYAGTGGCMYMKIDGYLQPEFPFLDDTGSSTIGLFGFEEMDDEQNNPITFVCTRYTSSQIDHFLDTPWSVARIFGILANIVNGLVMVVLIIASCVSYPSYILKGLSVLAILGSLCQWLTFTIFASSNITGTFFVGAGLTIVGALSSIITAIAILQIQPPSSAGNNYTVPPSAAGTPEQAATKTTIPYTGRLFAGPRKKKDAALPEAAAPTSTDTTPQAFAPGTETVTETVLPDGSRKVTTTTVNYDGSQTVTERIVSQSEQIVASP